MSESQPTAGAMRAAGKLVHRYHLGPNQSTYLVVAHLIDREVGLRKLLEATENLLTAFSYDDFYSGGKNFGLRQAARAAIATTRGE